jgi:hypothetical protein
MIRLSTKLLARAQLRVGSRGSRARAAAEALQAPCPTAQASPQGDAASAKTLKYLASRFCHLHANQHDAVLREAGTQVAFLCEAFTCPE